MADPRRFVTVGDDFRLPQRILDTLQLPTNAGVEYVRSTPSAQWSIVHSLQRRPQVAIYDATGTEVEADVVADATSVIITFPSPMTGSVVLT